jgi:isopentenyldiphosphate isomerase
VVSANPEPSILYQQRSPRKKWAPGLLDVAAGGHRQAGEKLTEGLREVEEELGKHYALDQLIHLGKKLYVGFHDNGTSHNNAIDVYLTQDDSPLDSYKLQESEVHAVCRCSIKELLKVHRDKSYSFEVQGLSAEGKELTIAVSKASFPENYWDDYHFKLALLAECYFKGEKDLLY